MTDFENGFNGWSTEQVGHVCAGCDLPANVNDVGLCPDCYQKLDRDLIRARDWDYSETAAFTPPDQRETLRTRVIQQYGTKFELIAPPSRQRPAKRQKSRPTNKPKIPQPVPPAEPITDYGEEDILDAIEVVVRATTKAYGWRHLSDIGSYLRQTFADFDPAAYGCKNLLQLIEKHPERFKIKWSALARKGASHVWVRLAAEPKRKEGYCA